MDWSKVTSDDIFSHTRPSTSSIERCMGLATTHALVMTMHAKTKIKVTLRLGSNTLRL